MYTNTDTLMDFLKILLLGPPCMSCTHPFIPLLITLKSFSNSLSAGFSMGLLSLHSLIQQMVFPASTITTQATFFHLLPSSHTAQLVQSIFLKSCTIPRLTLIHEFQESSVYQLWVLISSQGM